MLKFYVFRGVRFTIRDVFARFGAGVRGRRGRGGVLCAFRKNNPSPLPTCIRRTLSRAHTLRRTDVEMSKIRRLFFFLITGRIPESDLHVLRPPPSSYVYNIRVQYNVCTTVRRISPGSETFWKVSCGPPGQNHRRKHYITHHYDLFAWVFIFVCFVFLFFFFFTSHAPI